jgi:hypothetical protein
VKRLTLLAMAVMLVMVMTMPVMAEGTKDPPKKSSAQEILELKIDLYNSQMASQGLAWQMNKCDQLQQANAKTAADLKDAQDKLKAMTAPAKK